MYGNNEKKIHFVQDQWFLVNILVNIFSKAELDQLCT